MSEFKLMRMFVMKRRRGNDANGKTVVTKNRSKHYFQVHKRLPVERLNPSLRYTAHRLFQTAGKGKGGPASWHLQHLLVSSNFPRLKPRTSPLPKVRLPRGAAVCTGERAHVPLHVARVHVAYVCTTSGGNTTRG